MNERIKNGIKDLFYICIKELKNTIKDQGVFIFFIIVPLFYPLLYSFIYTNETVHEVPTVVVDMSNTPLSREYIRKVDATPEVNILAHCANFEDGKEQIRLRKAYGLIYIPSEFSKDIASMQQTHVKLFCDMSGLLYYKSILIANTAVSLEMNDDIKIQRAGNITDRQDELLTHPLKYEDVSMFNPANGFAAFLIPAVLILIIQQTLLLGIGMSVGTDREHNRFSDFVAKNRHYNGVLRVILGKGLCYYMIYAVISVYVLCVVPNIFDLNHIGMPSDFVLFMLPYLAACIFFAMTTSILIRDRETCMLLFVFTSVPLLFLSGISWPSSAIPTFWKGLSYLFPSTFGINGFVKINNMGATLNEISFEYKALWVQAGLYFITTFFVYRYQLIRSRRKKYNDYKYRNENKH